MTPTLEHLQTEPISQVPVQEIPWEGMTPTAQAASTAYHTFNEQFSPAQPGDNPNDHDAETEATRDALLNIAHTGLHDPQSARWMTLSDSQSRLARNALDRARTRVRDDQRHGHLPADTANYQTDLLIDADLYLRDRTASGQRHDAAAQAPIPAPESAPAHNPSRAELDLFAEFGVTYAQASNKAFNTFMTSDRRLTSQADHTLDERTKAAGNKMKLLHELQRNHPAAAETLEFDDFEARPVLNALRQEWSRETADQAKYMQDNVRWNEWEMRVNDIRAAMKYIENHVQ